MSKPNVFYLNNIPKGIKLEAIAELFPELKPMTVRWVNSTAAWVESLQPQEVHTQTGIVGRERVAEFLPGGRREGEGNRLDITAEYATMRIFSYEEWRTHSEFHAKGAKATTGQTSPKLHGNGTKPTEQTSPEPCENTTTPTEQTSREPYENSARITHTEAEQSEASEGTRTASPTTTTEKDSDSDQNSDKVVKSPSPTHQESAGIKRKRDRDTNEEEDEKEERQTKRR